MTFNRRIPIFVYILIFVLVLVSVPLILKYQQGKCSKNNILYAKYYKFIEANFGFEISSAIIDNHRRQIISGGTSPNIYFLDFEHNVKNPTLKTKFRGFRSLSLHEKKGYLVGGTLNGHVVLWQADQSSPNGWSQDYLVFNEKHNKYISSVAISRSGKLIGASSGNAVFVWGKDEGSNQWELLYKIFSGHSGRDIYDLVFGDDDQTLFTVGNDKRIKIWELGKKSTIKNRDEINSYNDSWPINSVVFISDENTIIYGTSNGQIKSWSTKNKPETEPYLVGKHRSQPVTSLATSPQKTLLVTGSNDHTIKIWDLCTKKELQELSEHSKWVRSVDISSDQMYIVSGGLDNKVIVWTNNSRQ